METTTIDLWPVLEPLLMALATALIGAAVAGVRWLLVRAGADRLAADASQLEAALDSAARYGIAKLRDRGVGEVTTKNHLLGVAVQHLVEVAPKVVKRSGFDPASAEGRRLLRDLVEAKLMDRLHLVARDVDGDGVPDLVERATP